jgi:ribosomal protein S18 acetylase RimI-like enzyme
VSQDWVVEPYQESDRAAVADITRAAWDGVTMAETRERRFGRIGGRDWREHKVDDVLSGCDQRPDQVLVARAAGAVVGYATFFFRADGEVGVVGNNAVHPDWQGRGIGTALIGRVIDELTAQGARILEVSTMEQDAAARRVYEKHGFTLAAATVHYARWADPAQGATMPGEV